jgi:hypothetical protein
MVSTSTQKGRVLKVRISDKKVIKTSGVLNTHHGNGMTYDSKRKVLVVVAREERKQELTVIDAATLKVRKQQNVKYSYYKNATSGSITKNHQERGLAAIAYSPRYDVYLALQRNYHNIERGNKSGMGNGCVIQSYLLDIPGGTQSQTAADPSKDECPVRTGRPLVPPHDQNHRNQCEGANQRSDSVECDRTYQIHTGFLRNESGPPDQGRHHQHQISFQFVFHRYPIQPSSVKA